MNPRPLPRSVLFASAALLALSSGLRAEVHHFDFGIDSAQSVPPVAGSAGSGVGTATYDDQTGAFVMSGTYRDLAGDLSFSVLHGPAPPGSSGPNITSMSDDGGLAGTFSLTRTLDAVEEAELLAGLWYVDFHTVFVGDGTELRGQIVPSVDPFCFGDGGQAGCTPCPCGNDAPSGARGGCLTEQGRSARLLGRGLASASADELRFELRGANPNTFALLASGDNALPLSGPCPPGSGSAGTILNGLRCVGGNLRRHGARGTDSNGDAGLTNNGWGGASPPAVGIVAQGGFAVGQTRQFQIFFREEADTVCQRAQGTTNAGRVTVVP